MFGFGTILNVAGVIAGGIFGLLFGKCLKKRYQDTLMSASGICVLFIGISGTMEQMLAITETGLKSGGTMMMIGCFSIGALLGEWLDLDRRFEEFGVWLKEKTGNSGDASFVNGFVSTSLTICIGAMAVVGSITDGLTGDYSILAAKSILDLIIVAVMTASLGRGCVFSAIPIGLFQGAITVLARFVEPIMTETALSYMSLTGSMLIFCVGVNLIWGPKVKVANLLPAVFLAVAWSFFPG